MAAAPPLPTWTAGPTVCVPWQGCDGGKREVAPAPGKPVWQPGRLYATGEARSYLYCSHLVLGVHLQSYLFTSSVPLHVRPYCGLRVDCAS